ncbi:MAG: hypothetical protein AAGE03_18565, partial [Pseudomonadota bacterium]
MKRLTYFRLGRLRWGRWPTQFGWVGLRDGARCEHRRVWRGTHGRPVCHGIVAFHKGHRTADGQAEGKERDGDETEHRVALHAYSTV